MHKKRPKGVSCSEGGPSVAKGAFRAPCAGMPVERLKELMGPGCQLTDQELEQLRDQLNVLAEAALDAWRGRMDGVPDRAARLTHQLETRGAANIEKVAETFESGSVATRKAMQRATDAYGFQTPGLTTGSADLTDNTGVLLPNAVPQGLTHPEGRQIYYGVREFAMGAIMVGQALHGGVRPVGSTFFVFSDYVRPAIRLAALSHASVLFVFTHDSIGVGEDGPTHQPIEHLAALRAMPRLHVVRPSDANETLRFVEDFLGQSHPPATALVLSRQDVPVLTGDEAAASLRDAHRGGYVVREVASAQLSLIATGSEVSLALSAADMLASNGVPVRVVALPCWRCFEGQPADYRASVLAKGRIPSVAVEAGSPFGWERYADEVIGIDDFGVSARWVESDSINTDQNAYLSAQLLRKENIQRILLVTDAIHMPRARLAFEHAGLQVIPAPSIFLASDHYHFAHVIPNAQSLKNSHYAIHEWLGLLAYRLRYALAEIAELKGS